jgi:radical SAM superfamily enzyme YgiQ (UPF0313 family)
MSNGGVKTTAGNNITTAIMYLIADLPGEDRSSLEEFWSVMGEIDKQLERKFTLFLSVSSFAPSPHTPMWTCPINLDLPFKKWYDGTKPFFKNLVIANRGALKGPAPRLAQMITIRGDERLSKTMFYLATKAFGVIDSSKQEDGRIMRRAIAASGYNVEDLTRQYDVDEIPPWDCVSTFSDAWKRKAWK